VLHLLVTRKSQNRTIHTYCKVPTLSVTTFWDFFQDLSLFFWGIFKGEESQWTFDCVKIKLNSRTFNSQFLGFFLTKRFSLKNEAEILRTSKQTWGPCPSKWAKKFRVQDA